jgi:hypothetical protein
MGLAEGCPMGDPVHNCPFTKICELDKRDKIKLLNCLSEMERVALIKQHYECLIKNWGYPWCA